MKCKNCGYPLAVVVDDSMSIVGYMHQIDYKDGSEIISKNVPGICSNPEPAPAD